ncbi:MAG TPA: Panacea domain-containing protein [Candidatus Aquicultor sp.]|jgi:uncharacterized phage-associated protein
MRRVDFMVSCAIRFKYDVEKFANVVAFFASKDIPDLTKLKICKLLFFVDKLHLQRYGRPVTGDVYYAMGRGPVPSVSLNVMNEAINGEASYPDITEETSVKIFAELVDINRNDRHPVFQARKQPELDVFSESELEVLTEVTDKLGSLSASSLIERTHDDVAWRRTAENSEIDFRLFLEDLDPKHKEALLELLEHDQENRDIFELSR